MVAIYMPVRIMVAFVSHDRDISAV